MSDRPAITTTEQAEAAVEAACGVLEACGVTPTRLLMSVAMFKLLAESNRSVRASALTGWRRLYEHAANPCVVTVTSTNPTVAFVTAYAE